jgi:hypothetical protein
MSINLNKKDAGLKLVKEVMAKKLTRQREIEQLSKLKNPYNKLTRPK